jgi:hypothetical protein
VRWCAVAVCGGGGGGSGSSARLQCVVHVVHRVDKGGVPLLDDVVEGVARLVILQLARAHRHALLPRALQLALEDLQLPHLVDHALVAQELDVCARFRQNYARGSGGGGVRVRADLW